ncbi:MAG: vanadium-dependent haloperoxidase [Anaerolineae bacterium]
MRFLRNLSRVLLLALVLMLLSTVVSYAQEGGTLADSVPAAALDSAPAIEWVNLVYDRIFADSVSAPAASRLYGYMTITLYAAAFPGMPGNNSLAGQLNGLTELPVPAEDAVYDWDASVDAALKAVLSGLFAASADSVAAYSDLYDAHIAAREAATSAEVVARSVAFGEATGAALLAWIATDGFAERSTDYVVPTDDPSTWVPLNENQRAVEPQWGTIRTTVLEDPTICDVPNDVPFSAEENSVFYAQAMEVMVVGQNLTDEQRQIAEYWIDTPGQSGTPAGHWVHIVEDLIIQEGFTLENAAELYAMTGTTLMDSFIATWNYKYRFPQIRPLTYINQHINPRWQTYLQTPGFPEYPSGHSVVSGAAATVMTSYFGGPRAFTNTNITPSGEVTRSFTSFWSAANEAAISRMYGGIHFRAAIENGVEMGRCIGNYIASSLVLNAE